MNQIWYANIPTVCKRPVHHQRNVLFIVSLPQRERPRIFPGSPLFNRSHKWSWALAFIVFGFFGWNTRRRQRLSSYQCFGTFSFGLWRLKKLANRVLILIRVLLQQGDLSVMLWDWSGLSKHGYSDSDFETWYRMFFLFMPECCNDLPTGQDVDIWVR